MIQIAIIYHSTFEHTKLQAEAVYRGALAFPLAATATLYTVEEATARLDELDSADAIIFGCPTYMGSMSAGMKTFVEVAAKKWYTLAWKDKVAGAFTNSSSFSGDKLNTLIGLVINAMQHGMIFVGLGMMPSANRPEEMKTISGPGPDSHNRVGSFIGPMASSFQVEPPLSAPPQGDTEISEAIGWEFHHKNIGSVPPLGDIETAELYGKRVAEITIQLVKGRQV